MEQLTDYSDERLRGGCAHCGTALDLESASQDHVPSKGLLSRPFPANLPVVATCEPCNASFSTDEEYLSVFLAAVITGDADPDPDRFPMAAASANHSRGLRERIAQARRDQVSSTGESQIVWEPEIERVHRVIVKNARGHFLYELGEAIVSPPSRVWCYPIDFLTTDQRSSFERSLLGAGWPEVGSRMMQRVAGMSPVPGGWVEVQTGVYRYAVGESPKTVRTVIRDYLATEVIWDFD